MKRLALLSLVLLSCNPAFAASVVVRDTIGIDGSLTDGLAGSGTLHGGATWSTPGMVLDVLETGNVTEVKMGIFARDINNLPENNLANILGYSMRLHVWSDGIQGGPDSFNDNAIGFNIPGHIGIDVNSSMESFITAQPFGNTGPGGNPTMFTTFLITMDLSSFDIQLQAGQQYVVGVTSIPGTDNFISGGGFYRHLGSRSSALTFEDLFQQFDTPANKRPGFLDSQHGFGIEQHAGAVTMGNGDFDGDHDVNGADFLVWQRNFGLSVAPGQDSNGDGIADAKDLAIWQQTYGNTYVPPCQWPRYRNRAVPYSC